MNEADFLKSVIDLAHAYKWKVIHFRSALRKDGTYQTPVQGDGVGFPDLILVRERVIFAELKSETGKISEAQVEWITALNVATQEKMSGGNTYIWRPSDWDQIVEILK